MQKYGRANQGIWKSASNAVFLGLISGLISTLIFGAIFGVIVGLIFGGKTCLQHFTPIILIFGYLLVFP
jgi:ABC-type dipeptide/oligopeptide/nickel transport system permease subunit